MNIQPINCYTITCEGSSKIPKKSYLIHQKKFDNNQALNLANAFRKFENKFRETMQTLIYMIKL